MRNIDDIIWRYYNEKCGFVFPASVPTAIKKGGALYLLHPINHNVYKIGESIRPELRKSELEQKLDTNLEFDIVLLFDDCQALEVAIHQKFRRSHIGGDWFLLSPDDVAWIKGLAK